MPCSEKRTVWMLFMNEIHDFYERHQSHHCVITWHTAAAADKLPLREKGRQLKKSQCKFL